MNKKMEVKETQAIKLMHKVSLTELDVCDDLLDLIKHSTLSHEERQKMISKTLQIRNIIASMTIRLDWKESDE